MAGETEVKILKNNTNVDIVLDDISNLVVPANGQLDLNIAYWAQFRQSVTVAQYLGDFIVGPRQSTFTYNNGTDDVHFDICEYYRTVTTQPSINDRRSTAEYDKRRVQDYTFPLGLSTGATSYTALTKFVLRGTTEVPPAKRIVAIASQSTSAGNLRLQDVTNNKTLADAVSFTAGSATIIVFTIYPANFPLYEAMVEFQGKTSGGVIPSVTAYSLSLFY